MKKFLLIFALLFPVVASAQQLPASGGRTQGMPDGYGDLVQVNCKTGCSGPSSSQLPATLGPKTGALSLSVVPNTDTVFPVSASSLPLPTGAATSALQTTMNTTLGSPFQAGGSIANTTFTVTQATASNFNAQVMGAGATGATAVGNPVGMACIYKSTPLTLTDGQRGDCTLGTRQATRVQLTLPDNVNNVGFQGAGADAYANNVINAYNSFGLGLVYNNTAWDRARSIQGALADGTGLGVTAVEQAGASFSNITTATTTTVKSGKGILHKMVLNTYVASATITIYDNTAASGTKIGTITLPSTITGDTPVTLPYDLQFNTGLTIVTSGATDITAIYR